MTPRTRMHRPAALAALALAACGGGAAQESSRATEDRAVTVRAVPVTDTLIARPIVGAGTVSPRDEVPLSFKTGGVIARIRVDVGDRVRAGRMLAALELREIDAALARARSGADKAERDLARARRLYADSVVTLAQRQDAETAAELARADLETASFNRRYSVIVAPSDGTILRRLAEPGETVSPGAPILVFGGRERGNVVDVALADRDAVQVRQGDQAEATFDALPGKTFAGRVTRTATAADAATGTYAIEIALADGDGLAAGLVGRVEIRTGRGAPASVIPIEAVLEGDGGEATVYALSDDGKHAERRRVGIAFIHGDRVAVARGLAASDVVLTDGAGHLDDGMAVTVAP